MNEELKQEWISILKRMKQVSGFDINDIVEIESVLADFEDLKFKKETYDRLGSCIGDDDVKKLKTDFETTEVMAHVRKLVKLLEDMNEKETK